MGVLVLYPTISDFKPTAARVGSLIALLKEEGIIGDEFHGAKERQAWDDGPAWDRLGIQSYSSPMTLSLQLTEPTRDGAFAPDDWEHTLMQQHFTVHIQDAGHYDFVDRSDPIWQQMEQVIGSPLSLLYYHV